MKGRFTMQIAVCDDDKAILTTTKRTIEQYSERRDYTVVDFEMPEELLAYAKTNRFDMVFMDIELGEISGIEVVKKLLKIQPDCQVIYYTNYLHYATEVYETEHCYYLLKGELQKRLPDIILKVEEKLARRKEKLIIKEGDFAKVIEAERIVFIERINRNSLIHTAEETIETRETLDEIYIRLNPVYFVRCHKSYIVNLTCITQYSRMELKLRTGQTLPISRQNIEKVRNLFLDWGRRQR